MSSFVSTLNWFLSFVCCCLIGSGDAAFVRGSCPDRHRHQRHQQQPQWRLLHLASRPAVLRFRPHPGRKQRKYHLCRLGPAVAVGQSSRSLVQRFFRRKVFFFIHLTLSVFFSLFPKLLSSCDCINWAMCISSDEAAGDSPVGTTTTSEDDDDEEDEEDDEAEAVEGA